ncbi:MAG: hypothetical protein K2X47_11980, partial [Bdellovibrionales bacterium]|nr:hypothetical protein [Bdellovibrionales bacterium]
MTAFLFRSIHLSILMIPLVLLQGCGCERIELPTTCVTQGQATTAYLSSVIKEDNCPAGWKCIPLTDTSPQNAGYLRSCGMNIPVATPTPVPTRPTPPINAGPAAGVPTMPGAISPSSTLGNPPLIAPRTCLQECAPSPRGNACVKLNLGLAQATVASHLADVVMKGKSTQIETPWILREFQMRADPCGRGATSLKAGKVINQGTTCIITAPVADLHAVAKIEIPATLQGNATLAEYTSLFDFNMASRRPSVTLMDPAAPTR